MKAPTIAALLAALAVSVGFSQAALPEPTAAAPAAPIELSAEDAVSLALSQGGDLYTQAFSVAAARRDAENAWNLFLPSFTLGAQARLSDELFFLVPPRPGDAGPLSATVSAGLQLSLGSAAPFELRKRNDDLRAALLREEEAKARLAAAVEKAYWSIAAMAADVVNKERALVLAEERYRAASRRWELGLGSELDRLRAELSVESAVAAAAQARADQAKRLAAFRRQLGLPADAELKLTGSLDMRPAHVLMPDSIRLERRHDVSRLLLSIEAAELQRLRSLATVKAPALELSASWNYSMAVWDPGTQRDSYALSASLRFNADAWIPGSGRDLSYRRVLDDRAKLDLDLRAALRQAEDELAALRADLDLAMNAAANAERQLSLAERIRSRTRELYERGGATLLELADAEQGVQAALQTVLSRRYQLVSLFIDLGLALNLPWRELAGY